MKPVPVGAGFLFWLFVFTGTCGWLGPPLSLACRESLCVIAMGVMENVLLGFAVYAGIGLLFAVAFVWKGLADIDPVAANVSIGFKIMVLPGLIVLWPIMFIKWVNAL